ncbi:hypothetical protein VTL71DRAFT_2576 [Oculimacula yallundae]|uniref:Uncharacterized protein n=1 Tax=Oculimacula yallundae TaxID=86028 RepID=A0ABR4C9Q3_9HELO
MTLLEITGPPSVTFATTACKIIASFMMISCDNFLASCLSCLLDVVSICEGPHPTTKISSKNRDCNMPVDHNQMAKGGR